MLLPGHIEMQILNFHRLHYFIKSLHYVVIDRCLLFSSMLRKLFVV